MNPDFANIQLSADSVTGGADLKRFKECMNQVWITTAQLNKDYFPMTITLSSCSVMGTKTRKIEITDSSEMMEMVNEYQFVTTEIDGNIVLKGVQFKRMLDLSPEMEDYHLPFTNRFNPGNKNFFDAFLRLLQDLYVYKPSWHDTYETFNWIIPRVQRIKFNSLSLQKSCYLRNSKFYPVLLTKILLGDFETQSMLSWLGIPTKDEINDTIQENVAKGVETAIESLKETYKDNKDSIITELKDLTAESVMSLAQLPFMTKMFNTITGADSLTALVTGIVRDNLTTSMLVALKFMCVLAGNRFATKDSKLTVLLILISIGMYEAGSFEALKTRYDLMVIVGYALFDWMMFEEKDQVLQLEPQSGLDPWMTGIDAIVGSFGKGFNVLSKLAKIIRDASSVMDVVDKALYYLKEFYCDTLVKKYKFPEFDFMKNFDSETIVLIEKIKDLERSFSNGSVIMAEETLNDIVVLEKRCETVYNKIKMSPRMNTQANLFHDYLKALRVVKGEMMNQKFVLNGFKQEPVAVCFQGPPGTFKTTIMRHVVSAVVAIAASKEQFLQHLRDPNYGVYNRVTETEFYDSYFVDTIVTIFDDAFQKRDTSSSQNSEAMEFIRMVNANEYMLHMAKLGDKGTMKFRSKAVLLTTNAKTFSFESINSAEAFNRRVRKFRFIPVPKKHLMKDPNASFWQPDNVDLSKLKKVKVQGLDVYDVHYSNFVFYRTDDNGDAYGEPIDFDDLVRLLAAAFKEKQAQVELHKRNFVETAEKYREVAHPEEEGRSSVYRMVDNIRQGLEMTSLPLQVQSDPRTVGLDINDARQVPRTSLTPIPWGSDVSETDDDAIIDQLDDTPGLIPRGMTYDEWIDEHALEDNATSRMEFAILRRGTDALIDRAGMRVRRILSAVPAFPTDEGVAMPSVVVRNVAIERQLMATYPNDHQLLETFYPILETAWDAIWRDPDLVHAYPAERRICSAFDFFKDDPDGFELRYKDGRFQPFLYKLEHVSNIAISKRIYHKLRFVGRKLVISLKYLMVGIFNLFDKFILQDHQLMHMIKLFSIMSVVLPIMTIVTGTIMGKVSALIGGKPKKTKNKVVVQSYEEANYKRTNQVKPVKTMREMKQALVVKNVEAQSVSVSADFSRSEAEVDHSVDKNAIQAILDGIYKKNVCNVQIDNRTVVKGLYITSDLLLLPIHCADTLAAYGKDDSIVKTVDVEKRVTGSIPWVEFLDEANWTEEGLEGTHLFIIRMRKCSAKPSITEKFVSEKALKKNSNFFTVMFRNTHSQGNEYNVSPAYTVSLKLPAYDVPVAFRYYTNTKVGDCGVPIVLCNNKLGSSIICGIHVAGSAAGLEHAYSTYVTKEQVRTAVNAIDPIVDPCEVLESLDVQGAPSYLTEKYRIIGKVKESMIHNPYPPRCNLVPSILFRYDGKHNTKRPSLIRIQNGIDPLEIAMSKYNNNYVVLDEEILLTAVEDYSNFIFSIPFPLHRRVVLTVVESLYGDPLLDSWNSIDSGSSAGHPMKYDGSLSLKDRLFAEGVDRSEANPDVLECMKAVQYVVNCALDGKRLLWVFTDNLKVELRELDKVRSGSTRAFSGAPFIFLVVFRMYFGAFMQFAMETRIENGTTIGINYYSKEWDDVVKYLSIFDMSEFETQVVAGDFSKFDGSLLKYVLAHILIIINKWYDDGNDQIRRILWCELVNSRHIIFKIIYEWLGSLPSGIPLTAVVGCMYNHIAFRYCYYSLDEIPDKPFHENVRLLVNSDDNILSVHQNLRDVFNQNTLVVLMAKLGMTYTGELKGNGVLPNFRPITEVSLLKRTFRYDIEYKRWVAPLSLGTILESPRWTLRDDKDLVLTYRRIEVYFEELSLHSEKVFDSYSKLMINAMSRLLPPQRPQFLLSYKMNKYRVLSRESLPRLIDESNAILAAEAEAVAGILNIGCQGWTPANPITNSILVEKEKGQVINFSALRLVNLPCTSRAGSVQPRKVPGICLQSAGQSTFRPSNWIATQENKEGSGIIPQNSEQTLQEHQEPAPVQIDSTTAFDHDGQMRVAQPDIIPINHSYYRASESPITSDIAGFLAKPRIVVSGTLANTDVATTFSEYKVPFDIINKQVYKDKLRGFFGFRATTVFTIVINGERFQQGRYMLSYVPLGGIRHNANNAADWIRSHSATLSQRTQLPRVEFDINCDTVAELRIPFSSSLDMYLFAAYTDANYFGSWGALRLFPYYQVESASGSNTASYTIWAHFEDVELVYPAVPQDLVVQSKGKILATKRKSPTEAEADSAGVGPISSFAFKVKKAANYLTPVPIIGAFASQLSWASDIVGNVASIFGWSAPQNDSAAHRIRNDPMIYLNNVDKVDNSYNLGLSIKNLVSVNPGFSSKSVDELDIAYFASIPSWTNTFDFALTNSTTDLLFSCDVTPMTMTSTIGSGEVSYNMTNMAWLANQSLYWRGGITFRLKIVKTEFHSGRILVAFTPRSVKTVAPNITYDLSDYLYRDIVDIRQHSEFEITVPYIASVPYKRCDTSADHATGTFAIYVETPLVAPATVPNTIHFLLERCAAPDFEVVGFVPKYVTPNLDVAVQSDGDTCLMLAKTLGTSKPGSFQLDTSQISIGERILNLRTLLKRCTSVRASIAASDFGSNLYTNIIPYGINYAYYVTGTVGKAAQYNDLYGGLSSIFMYSRGGVRLKAYLPTDTAYNCITYLAPLTVSGTFPQVVCSTSTTNINSTAMDGQLEENKYLHVISEVSNDPSIEVCVPQYHYAQSRSNADHLLRYGYDQNNGSIATQLGISITQSAAYANKTAMKFHVYRGGAEDTNFSGYVSIPPMLKTS